MKNALGAALAASTCLVSGCAFGPQMQRVAIDQNAMIADTANELAVVNILRASAREPLHFTSIAKATGSATFTGKGTGNVAIRGDSPVVTTGATGALTSTATTPGVEVVTPALEASIVTGSNLDVAVFDTQEFYQGITTSLTSSTIAHYLHQGWPADMLMYLMIEAVEFVPDPAASNAPIQTVWDNDPENPTAAAAFAEFVQCYPLALRAQPAKNTYLAKVGSLPDPKLSEWLQLDGEKFDIAPMSATDPTLWLVRRGRGSDSVTLEEQSACGEDGQKSGPKFTFQPFSQVASNPSDMPDHATLATGTLEIGGKKIAGKYQAVLRSTEGVIYYLGETLRKDSRMPKVHGRNGAGSIDLLAISQTRPDDVFIQARFRGQNWFIRHDPNVDYSRSSQAIAFIQQLVNLQKLSKDKPTTQSIRVLQ